MFVETWIGAVFLIASWLRSIDYGHGFRDWEFICTIFSDLGSWLRLTTDMRFMIGSIYVRLQSSLILNHERFNPSMALKEIYPVHPAVKINS